jgi:hypothetical protein
MTKAEEKKEYVTQLQYKRSIVTWYNFAAFSSKLNFQEKPRKRQSGFVYMLTRDRQLFFKVSVLNGNNDFLIYN